jgi:hypothetical protein
MLIRRAPVAGLLVAAAVILASCGSDGDVVTSDPGPRPDLPVRAESAESPLPAVTVRNLTDDTWIQLADLLPAEQPLLVWFWAPH